MANVAVTKPVPIDWEQIRNSGNANLDANTQWGDYRNAGNASLEAAQIPQGGRPVNPYPANTPLTMYGQNMNQYWQQQHQAEIDAWDRAHSAQGQALANQMFQGATNPSQQVNSYETDKLTQQMSLSKDPNKNPWESGQNKLVNSSGQLYTPSNMAEYFKSPVPEGMQGFAAGEQYGQNKVNQLYGSQDAKDIWSRLQDESNRGMDAASMLSLKQKYGAQNIADQARIAKSGMKGSAAFRAGQDLNAQKRQEAAAMDVALKKQAFNNYRDEWGRRSLMSLNYPIAYGQLGAAAMTGQQMQNLATAPLNTGAYSE